MSLLLDNNSLMMRNKVNYYSYLENNGKNPVLSLPVNKLSDKGSSFCSIAKSPMVFQNYCSFYGEIDPKDIDACLTAAQKSGVVLMAGSDPKNAQFFKDRGFLAIGGGNHMIMPIQSDKKPLPLNSNFEFASVETDSNTYKEDLAKWLEVFSKAFGFVTSDVPFYTNLFSNVRVGKGAPLHLLYIREKSTANVVSVGALFCDKDVAGVYNMATLETYRGKKLAESMLNHMIYDVSRDVMGMKVSMLQAAPKAIPLYKRFGFQMTDSGVTFIYTAAGPLKYRLIGLAFWVYLNHKGKILATFLAILAYIVYMIIKKFYQ